MTARFFAMAVFVCSVVIFLVSIADPQNPLFYIVSGGLVFCIVRLALAAVLLMATSMRLPDAPAIRIALGIFGLPLIIMGVAGLTTNSFDGAWFGLVKQFDFLFVIETGIIMNLMALQQQQKMAYSHFRFDFEPLPTHDRTLVIAAFRLHLRQLNTGAA